MPGIGESVGEQRGVQELGVQAVPRAYGDLRGRRQDRQRTAALAGDVRRRQSDADPAGRIPAGRVHARDRVAGSAVKAACSDERARWLATQVLPHEPALRAWLSRRLGAGLEVDDVVQEAYAVLVELPAVAHIREPLTSDRKNTRLNFSH